MCNAYNRFYCCCLLFKNHVVMFSISTQRMSCVCLCKTVEKLLSRALTPHRLNSDIQLLHGTIEKMVLRNRTTIQD